MAKYELEITIRPEDVDKRQTLASRIDMALALSGCRITAGEYDVIIVRKSAAQLRREVEDVPELPMPKVCGQPVYKNRQPTGELCIKDEGHKSAHQAAPRENYTLPADESDALGHDPDV